MGGKEEKLDRFDRRLKQYGFVKRHESIWSVSYTRMPVKELNRETWYDNRDVQVDISVRESDGDVYISIFEPASTCGFGHKRCRQAVGVAEMRIFVGKMSKLRRWHRVHRVIRRVRRKLFKRFD